MSLSGGEGWEYSRFPFVEYHTTKHLLDLIRRRRWLRRMVKDTASATSPKDGASPLFHISTEVRMYVHGGCINNTVHIDESPLHIASYIYSIYSIGYGHVSQIVPLSFTDEGNHSLLKHLITPVA